MLDSVMNPIAWWGLAALAVPIIIHLINRLRYKRIEWAAMEFLLKAMQKNKRKLLMEQLLLLLLRCLLIALVVLLIVRPLWFLGGTGSEAGSLHHHVILLDDSFSMLDADVAQQRAEGMNAFKRGTQLLSELAAAQATSNATHHWTVLTWSNPGVPELGTPLTSEKSEGTRLTTEVATRLKDRLDDLKPSALPLTPLASLQEAAKYLEAAKDGRKHLHIVSDFRKVTWLGAGDEVYQLLADLAKQNKVKVQLHDVAQPTRSTVVSEVSPSHGNLGVVQLLTKPRRTPDSVSSLADLPLRTVTPRLPFDVHVTVKNFGTAEHSKVKVTVRSGGVVKADRLIDRISGGEERTIVFNLEYGTDEPVGLKPISAQIEDAENRDHLIADDVRYAFLELRSRIQVLIVDPEARSSQGVSDWLYLNAALTGTARTGIQADVITPRELSARRTLSPYAVVYLLNIAGVGRSEGDLDEEGLRTLDQYVSSGGSLVYFLGPRTNVASFNDRLYQKGRGIFPVPLLLKPDPDGRKSSAYIDEEPDKDDYSAKLRFLKVHPAFPFTGEIADTFARFIHINRYFRIDPQWKPGEGYEPLVQLVNRRPLLLYRDQARALADELSTVAGEVPDNKLMHYVGKITQSVEDADKKKSRKGELMEALTGALGEPAAVNFWKDKKHTALQKKLHDLLAVLQLGDPVIVETSVSKGAKPGRVIAFLMPVSPTAIQGKDYAWHDMANGDLAQFFFVPMILGLQEHLASQSQASELLTSSLIQTQPLEIRLDKDRYHSQVEVWYQAQGDSALDKIDTINGTRVKPLYEPPPPAAGDVAPKVAEQYDWLVKIRALKGPGFYRLKFNQVTAAAGQPASEVKGESSIKLDTAKLPEERPLAFNLDDRTEGDLTRLAEDQLRDALADGLSKGPAKVPVVEAREFVQGKTWFVANALDAQASEALQSQSWSEYSWVLLLFIGLLILEQYLAMKFSHHIGPR